MVGGMLTPSDVRNVRFVLIAAFGVGAMKKRD